MDIDFDVAIAISMCRYFRLSHRNFLWKTLLEGFACSLLFGVLCSPSALNGITQDLYVVLATGHRKEEQ
jgi:hypothetical protein